MDDPFATVGGPPSPQEPGDPFHQLTQVSAQRRKAQAIRRGAIVAALVVVVLLVWDSAMGMIQGPGPDLPQPEAQSSAAVAETVSRHSQGAEQVASPTPTASALDQEVGDSSTLALLSGISIFEESAEHDEVPSGAFQTMDRSGPCSIRDIVLQQEATSGVAAQCAVEEGSWVSRYDGLATSKESDLVTDLIVSKQQAWIAGAWAWDQATRDAYANDIDSPETLIAVTATSAGDKAGRGIMEWRPSDSSYHCEYAASWVRIKYRWDLRATINEASTVQLILAECPDRPWSSPARADIVLDEDDSEPSEDESVVDSGFDDSESGSAIDSAGLDPRFRTCRDANATGFGPYVAGVDPEYDWYQDRDGDGRVCET